MVDFNNENTIGTPAADVVKIIILNRWWDLQEAREDYYKKKYSNIQVSNYIVRARTRTLFDTLQAGLMRRYDNQKNKLDVVKLRFLACNSNNDIDLDEAYRLMAKELDDLHLTRIDLKPVINRQNIEESNRAAGF